MSPATLIGALLLGLAPPSPSPGPPPAQLPLPAAAAGPLHTAPGARWICDPEHERWRQDDLALVRADVPKGPKGAAPDLPRLEAALAHAPAEPPGELAVCDGRPIAFTPTGALAILLAAAARNEAGGVDRRPLPYATLALLVGSVDNEAGRMDRALPALDRGLAVEPANLSLQGEKAFALVRLGRSREAADLCAQALAAAPPASGDADHPVLLARLHRLRGYALGEMGRFDEAVADYRASQAIDPAETISANEIRYLEGRKAGAPATPVRDTTTDQVRRPKP